MLNAVAATEISAAEYAEPFDSVWFDLSKGLGAPVGSVLAGSEEFIEKARYWKQRLGGAMRQAGIIAAGGIYALENQLERLTDDNRNAQKLAEGLDYIDHIEIEPNQVETNIVLFKIREIDAEDFTEKLQKNGVRMSVMGADLVRAVTHLHIDQEDIDYTLEAVRKTMDSFKI
jgi:threonine aldolase